MPVVEQDIGWTAIEASDRAPAGQQAQVRNAAQIEHGDVSSRPSEQRLMKRWHQRCALPAGGDVARAEVRHHVDVGEFRQQSGLHDLQCVPRAVESLRAMAHRLAMRTNRAHVARRDTGLDQHHGDHFAIQACQCIAGQCSAVELVRAARVQGFQLVTQVRGECPPDMGPDL